MSTEYHRRDSRGFSTPEWTKYVEGNIRGINGYKAPAVEFLSDLLPGKFSHVRTPKYDMYLNLLRTLPSVTAVIRDSKYDKSKHLLWVLLFESLRKELSTSSIDMSEIYTGNGCMYDLQFDEDSGMIKAWFPSNPEWEPMIFMNQITLVVLNYHIQKHLIHYIDLIRPWMS